MSNLLIVLIVVYIATIFIQIGYCISSYQSGFLFSNLLTIIFIIISIIFAPIVVLFEIGAALFLVRIN